MTIPGLLLVTAEVLQKTENVNNTSPDPEI